ncbi:MAG TPA: FHA domain-containing protein [Acidimicrobiales bacterium]|nr:FHA domain-containing protein [Acidimicrobiales bacterium]
MATCPAGHESTTDDYCDTCGAPIAAAPTPVPEASGEPGASPASPAAPAAPAAGPAPEAAAAPAVCPGCGAPVDGRFCESCGYDIESGTPAATATVTLQLRADRSHWDRMVGSGEPAFPDVAPTLGLELTGDRAMLGRIRSGAPVDVDLPLTGAAADPAVSHHQCEFVKDGASWTVRDAESANGTWINDATAPLAAGEAHTLAAGDRIFVGAWTCLEVRVVASAGAGAPG